MSEQKDCGGLCFSFAMGILWWSTFAFLVVIAFGPWFRDIENAAKFAEIRLALFSYLFGYFLPVIGIIYPYLQKVTSPPGKSVGIGSLVFVGLWTIVAGLWIAYSVWWMKYPAPPTDEAVPWTKEVPLASMPFPDCINYFCTVSIGILSGFGIVIQKSRP